jgi:hypothetical protein
VAFESPNSPRANRCVDEHIVRLRRERFNQFVVENHRNQTRAVTPVSNQLAQRAVVVPAALPEPRSGSINRQRRNQR